MSPTATSADGGGPAVALADVEMRFGTTRALRDIGFTVPRNSICGLVGPNGAGKTTTLRLIVADLQASAGEVEVLGHRLPGEERFTRPTVGYMPDSCGLYDELSLIEYLEFFARLNGLRAGRIRSAVDTAIELTGLEGIAQRRMQGLSRGESQRILLARTLIHDPELFVLDEPASGLDPRGRVELRMLLRLLCERGKTILISSHILADLEEICSHFVFIDRGRVRYQGTKAELFASRLHFCRIAIEVASGVERTVELLAANTDITLDEPLDHSVEITAPAAPAVAHRLLRDLVGAGVEVISFHRRAASLEDVYLQMTEPDGEGDPA